MTPRCSSNLYLGIVVWSEDFLGGCPCPVREPLPKTCKHHLVVSDKPQGRIGTCVVELGRVSFGITLTQAVSKDNECTAFTPSDLKSQLLKARNFFAGVPSLTIFSGRLCLPPKSTLQLSTRSLLIRNPICQVLFELDPSTTVDYSKPRSSGEVPQLLGGGEAQFETRLFGLKVETTYFALRVNHRDSGKYRDWCSWIVKGAQEWFEN
jgi:hypothetical protein